jgi:valine--pyruvate aminotransferase
MVYTGASPVWNEHLVLCLSLSKFGLPAVRTGIVIGGRELIRALSGMNAVVNLAPSSFGAMLTADLVRTGEILRLGGEVIRPLYQRRRDLALAALAESCAGLPYRVHVPEGAFFLWLWFPGLPVTSGALYERLKARGVLVVSGHWFFPGLGAGWSHTGECLRLTYSQDEAEVCRGMAIIGDEIRRVFQQSGH